MSWFGSDWGGWCYCLCGDFVFGVLFGLFDCVVFFVFVMIVVVVVMVMVVFFVVMCVGFCIGC